MLRDARGVCYSLGMTQTMEARTDLISGLLYVEQHETIELTEDGGTVEITLEAVEDDHATLDVVASVHTEAGLAALIAQLQARVGTLDAAHRAVNP